MIDFPHSLIELQHGFPDECACAAYLADARWPDGFRCPDCDHDKGWEFSTKAFTRECAGCGKQTSVTAGTVMHGSKLPLTVWFWAAYLMATHSNGIAALQLQKQLGLGSYKSAWLLCAKLRQAMVAPHRSPLAGRVEIDETVIPHRTKTDPPAGGQGRSADGKMLIAGAVEVHDGGPGRVRLAPIADFAAARLHQSQRRSRRYRENRRLVQLHRRSRRYSRPARRRSDGCARRPAVGASCLRQSENLDARRLSRAAPEAPAILSRRVRFPLQSPPHQTRRLPLPARHRRRPQTRYLQHPDPTGSSGISLNKVFR